MVDATNVHLESKTGAQKPYQALVYGATMWTHQVSSVKMGSL